MVVADGAGDGHIAYENLKRKGVLPNLMVRHYDEAHGARRLTSRPWAADSFTNEVVETIIQGKTSLTTLLQNSPDLQRILQSNLRKTTPEVQSNALASGIKKHRFDSCQMPLARAVMRHEAMVMTAMHISKARKGDHAAFCADYFLWFIAGEAGMRRLLLLGMLADAGDESMMVLRAHDKNKGDPADTAFWIDAYIKRIQMLFVGNACLEMGFTAVMVRTLQKPLVYTLKGTALQCGSSKGLSPSDISFCLAKMACWARLAIATAKAEFPDFTVMYAMSLFKLQPHDLPLSATMRGRPTGSATLRGRSIADDAVDEKLRTLASTFLVSEDALASEFHTTKDVAQASLRANQCDDRAAWRSAVLRCLKSRDKDKWPVANLQQVLHAWLGWNPGTSSIENGFSQYQAIFSSNRRGRMSRQREQDIMTLVGDIVEGEVAEIVKMAREIWRQHFYNVRKENTERKLNCGVRRTPRAGRPTLSRFLTARRQAVAKKLGVSPPEHLSAEALKRRTTAAWTDSMEREERHMKTKRARKLMETVAAGTVVLTKLLGGMAREEVIDIYNADQQRLQAQRSKALDQKRAVFSPKRLVDLKGKRIFWEPQELADNPASRRASVALHLRTIGNPGFCQSRRSETPTARPPARPGPLAMDPAPLHRTAASIADADVVVVRDFPDISLAARWRLTLNGGALAQLVCLTSGGNGGTCIVFKPAVKLTKRLIWTSTKFARKNPSAMEALELAMGSPESKWSWFVGNNEEFLRKALATPALFGLVTCAQYARFPRGFDNCMPGAMFLDRVRCLSPLSVTVESQYSRV